MAAELRRLERSDDRAGFAVALHRAGEVERARRLLLAAAWAGDAAAGEALDGLLAARAGR